VENIAISMNPEDIIILIKNLVIRRSCRHLFSGRGGVTTSGGLLLSSFERIENRKNSGSGDYVFLDPVHE